MPRLPLAYTVWNVYMAYRDGDLYLSLGGRKICFWNFFPNIGGAKWYFRPPSEMIGGAKKNLGTIPYEHKLTIYFNESQTIYEQLD